MHQAPCVHRKQFGNRVLIRYAEGLHHEHERNRQLSSVPDAPLASSLRTRNQPYPSQPGQLLKTIHRQPPPPPPPSSSAASTSTYQTAQTRITPTTDVSQPRRQQVEHCSNNVSAGNYDDNHGKVTAPVHGTSGDPPPTDRIDNTTTEDNVPIPLQQDIRQQQHPHTRPRTLHYRKAGIIFAPPETHNELEIDPDTVVKVGHMLCRRAVRAQYIDDGPTKYQSARQIDEWHQYLVELTYTHLEIYSTPALIWPHRRLEYSLHLKRITRFGLLSPLDYTFFVRYPVAESHHTAVMFSFRALSVTMCREWYMMLYRLLPDHVKPVCSPWCEVHIPMLDMQVRLPLWTSQNNNIRYDITLQSVQEAVLDVLEKDSRWSKKLASKLGEREELAMCWTRDNRTEWVYWRDSVQRTNKRIDLVVTPQHIEQTHRLELRHTEHSPSDIILADEATLREPPPVEGYLTRRTTFFGEQLGAASPKRRRRVYVASFEQFLFVVTHPTEAMQSPSEACCMDAKPETVHLSLYDSNDQLDKDELDRRMALMREASKIIDLTEMSYVRRSFEEDEEEHAGGAEMFSDMDSSIHADSMTPALSHSVHIRGKPSLQMIMTNGIVLKFEAETSETCDVWVRYLTNLSLYWRAHHEAERDIHSSQDSADILSNQYRQTVKGVDEAVKDLYKTPEVDTRIWSICWYTRCRHVVKSGVMYFQPRSRGTFSKKMFVLTASGWLLYFNPFERAGITCQPIQTAVHARKGKLDVGDCYVYTAVVGGEGEEQPPRIFVDGVVAAHSTDECLFSLWKPHKRRVFSPRRQRMVVYSQQSQHSQFRQQHGETFQFLARSRHEKDEWVWAINVVIEQLLRNQI